MNIKYNQLTVLEEDRLKNNYSVEELLYRSKLLLEKHGNPDPSVVKEVEVTTKEQRLGIEDSTNNMPTSAQHPIIRTVVPCKIHESFDCFCSDEDIV